MNFTQPLAIKSVLGNALFPKRLIFVTRNSDELTEWEVVGGEFWCQSGVHKIVPQNHILFEYVIKFFFAKVSFKQTIYL